MKTTTLEALAFPVAMQEIFDNEGRAIPQFRAIRRTDTGHTLSIVSPHYKLKSHLDALNPLIQKLGSEWEVTQVKVESEGAKAYVKAVNPNYAVKVDGHDIVPQLLLSNSYNRTKRLGADIGFWRVICSNGLKVPLEGFPALNFGTTHIGDVNDKFEDLLKRIGLFTGAVPQLVSQYATLTDKKVSKDQATDILEEILGKKKLDKVLWYWEGNGKGLNGNPTAWNLYNAVSEYLSNDYQGAEHLSTEYNVKTLQKLLSLR
jgi:hypothetical protein